MRYLFLLLLLTSSCVPRLLSTSLVYPCGEVVGFWKNSRSSGVRVMLRNMEGSYHEIYFIARKEYQMGDSICVDSPVKSIVL